jgi:hypothetical protein
LFAVAVQEDGARCGLGATVLCYLVPKRLPTTMTFAGCLNKDASLIVYLRLCNPMTKLLQVSAYGGDPHFCAWLIADLCGMGDNNHAYHQEDGEHLHNSPKRGAIKASSSKLERSTARRGLIIYFPRALFKILEINC